MKIVQRNPLISYRPDLTQYQARVCKQNRLKANTISEVDDNPNERRFLCFGNVIISTLMAYVGFCAGPCLFTIFEEVAFMYERRRGTVISLSTLTLMTNECILYKFLSQNI